ncbi:LysR family transcriptional regulator, partial [Thioclava sp. BHET1]
MIHLDAVTLKQLRALGAISQHGSITAAAEALSLTPPAVHAQIKAIEGIVGAPMLQRVTDSAGSRLAPAAEVLLDGIERIETILKRCGQDLHAMSSGQAGRVTLGISSTGKYFAPQLFKALRVRCPEIDIMLRIDHSSALLREMEQQAID